MQRSEPLTSTGVVRRAGGYCRAVIDLHVESEVSLKPDNLLSLARSPYPDHEVIIVNVARPMRAASAPNADLDAL